MEPDQEKLDSIQERYGFEEREAEAFWHLERAQGIILDLSQADRDRMSLMEERGELPQPNSQMGRAMVDVASLYERVVTHFRSLNRELGSRVLRRNYPEGWGLSPLDQEEESSGASEDSS